MLETGNNHLPHSLSICLSVDGFSFLGKGEKHIQFKKADLNYQRCMALSLCETALYENYSKIEITCANATSCILPTNVFNEKQATQLLQFSYPATTQLKVLNDNIEGHDLSNHYAIPTDLYTFLCNNFPLAKIKHQNSTFIAQALRESRKELREQIWVDVYSTYIAVALVKKGKLILSNQFPTLTHKDILYICGNIYEQFDLSQNSTELFLLGADEKLSALLSQYILNCTTKPTHLCAS